MGDGAELNGSGVYILLVKTHEQAITVQCSEQGVYRAPWTHMGGYLHLVWK